MVGFRGGRVRMDKPSLEILDPRHPLLCVDDHLGEQEGEAGPAELRRSAPV